MEIWEAQKWTIKMTSKYSYLMLSYILRTIKLIVLVYWILYNLLNCKLIYIMMHDKIYIFV